MRYLSVCSGIEAASVAWHHLGWTPVAFSEIEPFPSAVLAHHYPNVPNYGDMTKFEEWPIEPGTVDLLVGGTPCQSFSVAGLRKGISDPRGGLMLTYLEIARRFRPRWVVWENVPGVLSSGGGRDFGSLLGGLEELGYGWAYRVLDAQFVRTQRHPRAVPQRRRRVFVVGCLGDWKRAAQVLFERESVQRDSSPRGAARQGVAGTLAARSGECRNNHEQLVTSHDVAPCLETTCHDYSPADGFTMVAGTLGNRGLRSHTELDGHGAYVPVMSIQGAATRTNPASGPDGVGVSQSGVAYTLEARAEVQAVAQPVPYDLFQITAPVNRQNRKPGDPCHTLARDNAAHAAVAFETLQHQGYDSPYASTNETDAAAILRTLRNEIGEEAFAVWGLGVLDSLQPSQVLRSSMHGAGIRCAAFTRSWPIYCAISREEDRFKGVMQSVWEACGDGCASSRQQLPEQLARELGTYLSELSQPGAQAKRLMCDLWFASEGIGPLRQALSAETEARRSSQGTSQSTPMTIAVRRLTPVECEFLMGYPRDYTAIPWRNKPADECPDGPRYKALGNSMAVNCMAWIGERIAAVDSCHDL